MLRFIPQFIAISLVLAICSRSLHAATVTLVSVADTTLIENAPTNNMGGQYYFNAGTTQTYKRNRGLVRFQPLQQIPSGSRITAAKLILLVVGEPSETPSNPSQFNLHRLLVDWGEGDNTDPRGPDTGGLGTGADYGEATWNHRFALTTNTWTLPGAASGVDYVAQVSSSQFVYGVISPPYVFDTTSNMVADVQQWLDSPTQNFGWLLKTEDESVNLTARRFGSWQARGDEPQLVVDFIPPPTLTGAQITSNQMHFSFLAEADQNYVVQTADALPSTNWATVVTIPASGAETNVSVTQPLSPGQKFYRVIAP